MTVYLGNQKTVPILDVTKVTPLNVTPSSVAQSISPSGDIDAYKPVNINPVTAAVDNNIIAENIKNGVKILGVTGTFGGLVFNREVSSNNVYQMPTSSFTYSLPSGATEIAGGGILPHIFHGCTGLTAIDLSSLTTLSGNSALQYICYYCVNLASVDLSNLTTISSGRCMLQAFNGCTSLTSIEFTNLTTISGSEAMYYAFNVCSGLTISFPKLTSSSFGSYSNQFHYMLYGASNCTVHFPSNLQSIIGSWSDVMNGFGGNSTTVLFDLPATT